MGKAKGFKGNKKKGTAQPNQGDQLKAQMQLMQTIEGLVRDNSALMRFAQNATEVIKKIEQELSAQADTLRYGSVVRAVEAGDRIMLDVVGREVKNIGEENEKLSHNFTVGSSRGTVLVVGETSEDLVPKEVQQMVAGMELGEHKYVRISFDETLTVDGEEVASTNPLAGKTVQFDFVVLKIFTEPESAIDGIVLAADTERQAAMEKAVKLAEEAKARVEAEETETTEAE